MDFALQGSGLKGIGYTPEVISITSIQNTMPTNKPEISEHNWVIEGMRDPELRRWVVDLIVQEDSPDHVSSGLVVYLDEELSIQWYCMDANPVFFPSDFRIIQNDIVLLETISEPLRKKHHQDDLGVAIDKSQMDFTNLKRRNPKLRAARRLLGEALARAYGAPPSSNQKSDIDPRSAAAATAIQMAREYIQGRSSDFGRTFVITGATIAATLCAIIACICGSLHQTQENSNVHPPVDIKLNTPQTDDTTPAKRELILSSSNWDLIRFSLMGAAGAMLSLITSINRRDYDASAGRIVFIIEGATRICAGILGALLITLGIKSGLFFSFLTEEKMIALNNQSGEKFSSTFLFFGFIAGASERLVPSFINLVEAHTQSNPNSNSQNTSHT